MGRPVISKNRIPSSPACTVISSPAPNRSDFDLWLDHRLETGEDPTALAEHGLYPAASLCRLLGRELLRVEGVPETDEVLTLRAAQQAGFVVARQGDAAGRRLAPHRTLFTDRNRRDGVWGALCCAQRVGHQGAHEADQSGGKHHPQRQHPSIPSRPSIKFRQNLAVFDWVVCRKARILPFPCVTFLIAHRAPQPETPPPRRSERIYDRLS